MPCGGANNRTKLAASGSAEASSMGCRLPQRVLIRSDQAPISGSVTASIITGNGDRKPDEEGFHAHYLLVVVKQQRTPGDVLERTGSLTDAERKHRNNG